MLRASISVPILVSVVAAAISVQSQDSPRGTSLFKKGVLGLGVEAGFNDKSTLLHRPQVQEDISLTPAQKERLKVVEEELSRGAERRREVAGKTLQDIRDRGDSQALAALQQQASMRMYSLTNEFDVPLLNVLDRRQRTRLEEIQLQADGPLAFLRPEVQVRLNLAPGQVESIRKIVVQGDEAMKRAATVPAEVLPTNLRQSSQEYRRTLMESESFRAQVDKTREAVIGARRMTMQMIAKALTKRQHAAYERMLGEPFDFAQLRPGPASTESKQESESKPETKAP